MGARARFLVLLTVVALLSLLYYLLFTDHSRDLVLTGVVDANQVVVSPQIQGRIQKLLVEEGTQVKAGDLIATLDPSALEAERRAAAATVSSLRSRVLETLYTEKSTRGSTHGDVADAKARLSSAQAQLLQAEAILVKVESESRRAIELARDGVVSDQDRVQAEANWKAQAASVQALEELARAAEAALDSAVARTHQAGAAQSTVASTRGELASAEAQLEEVEVRLGYTQIRAPISGTVSVRVAREGEVLAAGSPIVTIVDLADVWVRAPLPETNADHVGLGDVLRIRLPGGSVTTGQVFFKAVEAEFATQRDVSRQKRDIRTIVLKVRLDNPHGAYVPGMTAEVLIAPEQLQGSAPVK